MGRCTWRSMAIVVATMVLIFGAMSAVHAEEPYLLNPFAEAPLPFGALAEAEIATINREAMADGSSVIIPIDATPGVTSLDEIAAMVNIQRLSGSLAVGRLYPAGAAGTALGRWKSVGDFTMYCADCLSAAELGGDAPGITPIHAAGDHDVCVLSKGLAIFTPTRALEVHTQEGVVHAAAGAEALVIETGREVAIYNLHDLHHGGVTVVAGCRSIRVPLGRQLVLTRKSDANFNEANPGVMIASRNPQKLEFGSVTGFLADFSILSAIAHIAPLRNMIVSNQADVRRLGEQIIRNAAIMATISGGAAAYKSNEAFQSR